MFVGNDILKKNGLMPLRDADGGQGGNDGGSGNDGGNDGGSDGGNGNDGGKESEKKFTQEQLNSILASDKKKVQAALYKELGFDDEESAKEFITKYKEKEDANKSELEKATANNTALKSELKESKNKVSMLENKFKALELGCNPDSAEDVVILANAKVSDGKDFDTALNEVKEKFPSMFTQTTGGNTGGAGTPPRGKTHEQAGDLGKRLAEGTSQGKPKKDDYFTK